MHKLMTTRVIQPKKYMVYFSLPTVS